MINRYQQQLQTRMAVVTPSSSESLHCTDMPSTLILESLDLDIDEKGGNQGLAHDRMSSHDRSKTTRRPEY